MSPDELLFFNEHPGALEIYAALRKALCAAGEDVRVEVKKTQISFFNRHMYAAVSFLPVRPARERPAAFITLTFGLRYRLDSPRVGAAAEARPGRWTHHVLISREEDIDKELLAWAAESAAAADLR